MIMPLTCLFPSLPSTLHFKYEDAAALLPSGPCKHLQQWVVVIVAPVNPVLAQIFVLLPPPDRRYSSHFKYEHAMALLQAGACVCSIAAVGDDGPARPSTPHALLCMLHLPLLCMLHLPLLCMLHLPLLCMLHLPLLCMLHLPLLCMLHLPLLCMLHLPLLCMLHLPLLCMLHLPLLCMLHLPLICMLHLPLICMLHLPLLCMLHLPLLAHLPPRRYSSQFKCDDDAMALLQAGACMQLQQWVVMILPLNPACSHNLICVLHLPLPVPLCIPLCLSPSASPSVCPPLHPPLSVPLCIPLCLSPSASPSACPPLHPPLSVPLCIPLCLSPSASPSVCPPLHPPLPVPLCIPLCLSPFASPSACPPLHPPLSVPLCIPLCLSPSASPSVCPPLHPPLSVPLCISLCLSPSASPSACPPLHPPLYSSQFKYEDAMALLQSGACVQLEHGQVTSGGELALLLTDLLSSTETPCWEDSLAHHSRPHHLLRPPRPPTSSRLPALVPSPSYPSPERITAVYTSFPRSTDPSGLLPGESEEAARLRVDGCKRFLRAALKYVPLARTHTWKSHLAPSAAPWWSAQWSAQFPEMLSAPSSPQAQAKPSSPTASSPAALASLGSPAIHLMLAHCLSSQLPPHKRVGAFLFSSPPRPPPSPSFIPPPLPFPLFLASLALSPLPIFLRPGLPGLPTHSPHALSLPPLPAASAQKGWSFFLPPFFSPLHTPHACTPRFVLANYASPSHVYHFHPMSIASIPCLSLPSHVYRLHPMSIASIPCLSPPSHVYRLHPMSIASIPCLSPPSHVYHLHPMSITSIPCLSPPSHVYHLHPMSIASIPCLSPPSHVYHFHPMSIASIPCLSPPSHVYRLHPMSIASIPCLSPPSHVYHFHPMSITSIPCLSPPSHVYRLHPMSIASIPCLSPPSHVYRLHPMSITSIPCLSLPSHVYRLHPMSIASIPCLSPPSCILRNYSRVLPLCVLRQPKTLLSRLNCPPRAPPPTQDYAAAFFHFVYSDDPALFAHSLAEYAQQCYLGERDLVIARAIEIEVDQKTHSCDSSYTSPFFPRLSSPCYSRFEALTAIALISSPPSVSFPHNVAQLVAFLASPISPLSQVFGSRDCSNKSLDHSSPMPPLAHAPPRPCPPSPMPPLAHAPPRPCPPSPMPPLAHASPRPCLPSPMPPLAHASPRPCLPSPMPPLAHASPCPCLPSPMPPLAHASPRPCLPSPMPPLAHASPCPCLPSPMPPLAHASPRPCLPSLRPPLADAPFLPCPSSLRCLAAGRLQQGKQLWHDLKTKQAGIWGADDHAAGDDGADADGAADAAAAVESGATEDRAGAAASKWQESPLLRFTDLLLTAADRRAPSLLSHLRRRYEPSLQRDPAFPPLLDDIAFRLFGVPRPAAAPNFLTDMLKLVMGEETPA
ncbi:unnamed protein product [Closterium sp. NIES-65]|nr:unnamed protein product [Closterium sp. NIES-65]